MVEHYINPQEYISQNYSDKENTKKMIFNSNELEFEQAKELIISDYPSLEIIEALENNNVKNITKVTIQNCPQLKEINITNFIDNQELVTTNCPNLEYLSSGNNQLSNLKLSNLPNLRQLQCWRNQLTNLDLSNNHQLTNLGCSYNQLTELKTNNLVNLKELDCRNNNLLEQDLSFFSQFINLENLWIGGDDKEHFVNNTYNKFYGSLEPLKNLVNLKDLHISNTDINDGVEYLPNNLKKIQYSSEERPESKVKEISEKLKWIKFKEWIDVSFKPQYLPWVQQWKKRGFSPEQTKQWIEAGFKLSDWCEVREWREWLKDVKGVNVKRISRNIISSSREEYEKYLYTRWTIDVKGEDARFLKKDEDKKFRREYNEFLEEVKSNSKLSLYAINEIKHLENFELKRNTFNELELTQEQETLLEGLIPNKNLRGRYKKYGLCRECKQPNTGKGYYSNEKWCQDCNSKYLQLNFGSWTSGNSEIDKFIQRCQSEATDYKEMLEWIPYKKFSDIGYLAEGGFSKVYKAKWGVSFNKWIRDARIKSVVLKHLVNSKNMTTKFLEEVACHKFFRCDEDRVVECYGITQDPETKDYVMVMNYIRGGDMRKYLNNNRLKFYNKLIQLRDITLGLKSIHEKGLMHRDFHPGNILNVSDMPINLCDPYITDLGLSKPADEADNRGKIYGVLPYVAPEVLCGKSYTQAADIYSFGIVAYEVLSGLPPYYELPHNEFLALYICYGLRPDFNVKIPKLLEDLINRCWRAKPHERPTASEIYGILSSWWNETRNETSELYCQYKEAEEFNERMPDDIKHPAYKIHPSAVYTSRLLDFKNLPKPQNSKEINDLFYKLKDSGQLDLVMENSKQNKLRKELEEINKELQNIKETLDNESVELVEEFIIVKKKLIRNKKDEQVRKNAIKLEEQLEKKGFTEENIEKIIHYCKKAVNLEKRFEQEKFQVQVEIPNK